MRLFLKLLVATACAALAGWLGWLYASNSIPEDLPVGDRVQSAIDGLRTSNVYVDPDMEGLLSPDELGQVNSAAAKARPEVFIVLWRQDVEAGYDGAGQALDQIGAELGRPGFYITVGPDGNSWADVGIEGDYGYLAEELDTTVGLAEGELAAGLLKTIARNDEREYDEANTTGSDYWGGTGGTIAAGALFGVLAGGTLAGVLVSFWFLARRRRSSP